jgi:hypothetical protein
LSNFTGRVTDLELERLHALFWLSQFMYFGSREIRVLLKSLFRDLYFRPMIYEVRSQARTDISAADLLELAKDELAHTRFFGVGNPSESGVHLLYFFRQENALSKSHFMDAVQIFSRDDSRQKTLRDPGVRRYVFLDDICGSGDTAATYSDAILVDLQALNPRVEVAYYCLFASADGLKRVREQTRFGPSSAAVYELDSSYRSLSPQSRYLACSEYPEIDPGIACAIVREYGNLLDPDYASGYKDSQLLLGFHHNTPDNTLGIMWCDSIIHGAQVPWIPIFKRYPKIYGDV